MLHVGQNSCKCFSCKSKIGGRALHHQEKGYLHQATNSHLLWVRTAANASRGPEQLQMLQLQKQDRRQSIAEGIFTPSYELTFALGENSCKCFTWAEQLQMQNSCKCFSYKCKIGGRVLQKGHQATYTAANASLVSFLF